jgi:hypothetical protein
MCHAAITEPTDRLMGMGYDQCSEASARCRIVRGPSGTRGESGMKLCDLMLDIQLSVRDITPGSFWDMLLQSLFAPLRFLLGCPLLYMT